MGALKITDMSKDELLHYFELWARGRKNVEEIKAELLRRLGAAVSAPPNEDVFTALRDLKSLAEIAMTDVRLNCEQSLPHRIELANALRISVSKADAILSGFATTAGPRRTLCRCSHERADHQGMGPSRGRPVFSACGVCACQQWRPKSLPQVQRPCCPKCRSEQLEMHYLDVYVRMACLKCGAWYDCEFPSDFAQFFAAAPAQEPRKMIPHKGKESVCKHCREEIVKTILGWITDKSRDILCFTEMSVNPRQGGHEPVSEPASTGEPPPKQMPPIAFAVAQKVIDAVYASPEGQVLSIVAAYLETYATDWRAARPSEPSVICGNCRKTLKWFPSEPHMNHENNDIHCYPGLEETVTLVYVTPAPQTSAEPLDIAPYCCLEGYTSNGTRHTCAAPQPPNVESTCTCNPKPLNGQHWTGCPEGKVEEIIDALEDLLTDCVEDSDNGTQYWTAEGRKKVAAILRPASQNSHCPGCRVVGDVEPIAHECSGVATSASTDELRYTAKELIALIESPEWDAEYADGDEDSYIKFLKKKLTTKE